MNIKIRELRQRRYKALAAARALTDSSDELSAEDAAEFDSLMATVRNADASIARQEALDAEVLAAPSPSSSGPRVEGVFGGGEYTLQASGFRDPGDFMAAVIRASHPHQKSIDDRLRIGAAPTTYGNEAVGEDGGYLVPTEIAREIAQYSLGEDALLPLTNNTPVAGNSMALPVSEAMPWGSSGIRVFWEGEGAQATQVKPAFESRELRLRKLMALAPVTDELLEDQIALASWLPSELGQAARWKTNDAIVNGSGAGIPQGFTQSGSLVTQAKEGSQTADTIVAGNVAKMYARCTNPTRAVWLLNPDAFNQLPLMVIGDQPVWQPSAQGAPGGTLFGRPVILTDACQTLGDAGDIYFCDLGSYFTITKRGGQRIDTSMHLYFDYGMTAFRLTFRVDGQSAFRNPITPPNSSVTRSPFVRLAART